MTAPVRSAENDGRRTFSFGAVAMPGRMTRKITRQMTISGDSAYSTGKLQEIVDKVPLPYLIS